MFSCIFNIASCVCLFFIYFYKGINENIVETGITRPISLLCFEVLAQRLYISEKFQFLLQTVSFRRTNSNSCKPGTSIWKMHIYFCQVYKQSNVQLSKFCEIKFIFPECSRSISQVCETVMLNSFSYLELIKVT